MIQEYQLRVLPEQCYNEESVKDYISKEKGLDRRTVNVVKVLKKSIDARQRTIYVNLKVRVYINEYPDDDGLQRVEYQSVAGKPQVIVVGEGPAGLFASLKLIELGLRPVVIERGKDVRERKKDIAQISRTDKVNPESNYCFGEGGAGAYSDGKLYTRSKKRGNVDKILNVFCQHGASASILYEAHPHIGTDKLPRVIENMRNTIIKCGGEVHFQTKMTSLLIDNKLPGGVERVAGVAATHLPTGEEQTFKGPVILATGHSARDVYRYLNSSSIEIEPKGIAVGVRLEHPAALIDQIQYHNKNGKGKYLPTAEYSMVTQVNGRGVYSFCMCPGGFVIPSATGPGQIVTNGMSPANRNTQWSNAGMVVEVRPEDTTELLKGMDGDTGTQEQAGALGTASNNLSVMRFQELLEKETWRQGNMSQTAPAQRMSDFVNGRLSFDLPKSSYAPGLISSPVHFWMPNFITSRLQEGFKFFGKHHHGFLTNEAVVIATETRTSSPVRILRNRENLMHIRLQGLFPCGEGAGYAGGIVSAGIDGERCAEMCAEYIRNH